MQCRQPCNSHVYFNIFIRSGYLCFETPLVLLFNYKTYGLVQGGFTPPPYPTGGCFPRPPQSLLMSFFYLLNYLKHVFQKFGIFFEKNFFLTHEPLLMLFFQKSCVSVRTDGRKIIFGYYLGNSIMTYYVATLLHRSL